MVFVLGEAQRPPYAGSANRYPVVIPRFREEQDAVVAAAFGSENRVGDSSAASEVPATSSSTSTSTTTSTIPPDLPIDALGDINLVNRIKTWPKEKQPFWYINWKQIQEHRGDSSVREAQPNVNSRSFFAG